MSDLENYLRALNVKPRMDLNPAEKVHIRIGEIVAETRARATEAREEARILAGKSGVQEKLAENLEQVAIQWEAVLRGEIS